MAKALAGRTKRPPINNYPFEHPNRNDAQRNVYNEFARRLQRAMIDKGWTQSELGRRASDYHPGGTIQRSSISKYCKGDTLATPAVLAALAKALGKKEEELLPPELLSSAKGGAPSPFSLQSAGDDRMSIQLNRTMSTAAAMKIVAILAAEDAETK